MGLEFHDFGFGLGVSFGKVFDLRAESEVFRVEVFLVPEEGLLFVDAALALLAEVGEECEAGLCGF